MNLRFLVVFVTLISVALTAHTASAAPLTYVGEFAAHAEFIFVSESAVFNPATQEVEFTIEFSEPPDFFTVDSFGQPANSFQYFIVGDAALSWPENFDAIIRGAEIYITTDGIPVRNAVPSDPDAGGWGEIRGVVAYQLTGNVLTFSVPLQLISDHSWDGSFDYELETYQFGSLTKHVDSHSVTPILTAHMDIRPRNSLNMINPRSRGVIPVAILTTPTLDARTVDPLSVELGPSGAHEIGGRSRIEDVDHDGDEDLVFYFLTQDTGITCHMESATLTGQTFSGQMITVTDSIKTIACQNH